MASLDTAGDKSPKILFLIDYWWRWEKLHLLRYLKDKISFRVITHDQKAYEAFKQEFDAALLDIVPLKKGLRYYSLFLLAKDLDTNNVRYRKNIRRYTTPYPKRLLFLLRHYSEKLGIPRHSYTRIFDRVYGDSKMYDEVLKDASALVVTPVQTQDKRIIYEARKRGIKICYWVYSWDHPVKDNEFMADADHFLVWNDYLAKQLMERYRIPAEKISITGPVQFNYLVGRKSTPDPTSPRYLLYACAGSLDAHVDQEVTNILNIRKLLDRIEPETEIWVRPYPFRNSHEVYHRLQGVPGIKLLAFGIDEMGYLLMNEKEHLEKIKQVENAVCLINNSSTIALEASFCKTPVLQTTFTFPNTYPWYFKIDEYFKNDHLQVLNNPKYKNVIKEFSVFETVLSDILAGNGEAYMAYSDYLQEFAHPLDTDDYMREFLHSFQRWMANWEQAEAE